VGLAHPLGQASGVIEVREQNTREALPDLALDPRQRSLLGRRNEHKRVAFRFHPGRAADAVDVVVRHGRHVETDYVSDVIDIQPSGGDVGRHQDLEVVESRGGAVV
jgi:hypothetical protein